MDKLSRQLMKKPRNLEEHDLIAILNIYDVPTSPMDILNMPYSKSELAFNDNLGIVQVYVSAKTKAGIQKFKKDYPNAEIKKDATLDNSEEWKVIAFPPEPMPDESTALDNYFQVRGRELSNTLEDKTRKELQRRRKERRK